MNWLELRNYFYNLNTVKKIHINNNDLYMYFLDETTTIVQNLSPQERKLLTKKIRNVIKTSNREVSEKP